MLSKALAVAASMALPLTALAQLDLSQYQLAGRFPLSSAASEASAVTFNWDTGTLFVVGDEGDAVVEVSTAGVQLSTMSLTGFDDTEGLTYIGGGQFVIVEERLQDVYRMTYTAGGSVAPTPMGSPSRRAPGPGCSATKGSWAAAPARPRSARRHRPEGSTTCRAGRCRREGRRGRERAESAFQALQHRSPSTSP